MLRLVNDWAITCVMYLWIIYLVVVVVSDCYYKFNLLGTGTLQKRYKIRVKNIPILTKRMVPIAFNLAKIFEYDTLIATIRLPQVINYFIY